MARQKKFYYTAYATKDNYTSGLGNVRHLELYIFPVPENGYRPDRDDGFQVSYQATERDDAWRPAYYGGRVQIEDKSVEKLAEKVRLVKRIFGKDAYTDYLTEEVLATIEKKCELVAYDGRAGRFVTQSEAKAPHLIQYHESAGDLGKTWANYFVWAADIDEARKKIAQLMLEAGDDDYLAKFLQAGKPVGAGNGRPPTFESLRQLVEEAEEAFPVKEENKELA